eukprot:scaffold48_cov395-Prasinococcus_capsulatus_cf.AAC.22
MAVATSTQVTVAHHLNAGERSKARRAGRSRRRRVGASPRAVGRDRTRSRTKCALGPEPRRRDAARQQAAPPPPPPPSRRGLLVPGAAPLWGGTRPRKAHEAGGGAAQGVGEGDPESMRLRRARAGRGGRIARRLRRVGAGLRGGRRGPAWGLDCALRGPSPSPPPARAPAPGGAGG